MGAVSPVPFATETFLNKIEERMKNNTRNIKCIKEKQEDTPEKSKRNKWRKKEEGGGKFP